MRNATSFRIYATATGLLLVLLVVGLWASGMLAAEVRVEAELGFSTSADEFPFLTTLESCALLPDTVLRAGLLPSWPISHEAFILWPRCLHAHHPISRGPPRV